MTERDKFQAAVTKLIGMYSEVLQSTNDPNAVSAASKVMVWSVAGAIGQRAGIPGGRTGEMANEMMEVVKRYLIKELQIRHN